MILNAVYRSFELSYYHETAGNVKQPRFLSLSPCVAYHDDRGKQYAITNGTMATLIFATGEIERRRVSNVARRSWVRAVRKSVRNYGVLFTEQYYVSPFNYYTEFVSSFSITKH